MGLINKLFGKVKNRPTYKCIIYTATTKITYVDIIDYSLGTNSVTLFFKNGQKVYVNGNFTIEPSDFSN